MTPFISALNPSLYNTSYEHAATTPPHLPWRHERHRPVLFHAALVTCVKGRRVKEWEDRVGGCGGELLEEGVKDRSGSWKLIILIGEHFESLIKFCMCASACE